MMRDRMFTEDEIFDKAKEELFRLLAYCFDHPQYLEKYTNQAFGTAQFAAILCPAYEKEIVEMWESWKKSVDNLALMCYNH